MSRKWQRAKRWDDEHLSTWPLRPVKWVLRAFSSIWLAVILLTLVSVYGVLASVPIGMLALAPTWAFYGLTVAVPAGLAAGLAFVGVRTLVPPSRAVLRLGGSIVAAIVVFSGVCALWAGTVWPAVHFDPADGSGVRFFADFVRTNESITLRRLPGVEMTELEFYSWWPLHLILLAFVVNMITTTVRRIEFTFNNIGVLTVHTGIVVISLGSIYYQGLKKEGDTIVFAGGPGPDGTPTLGTTQTGFYDNTTVALWIAQRMTWAGVPDWEQRPLKGLPRYNDYALGVASSGDRMRLGDLVNENLPGTETPPSLPDLNVPVAPGSGQRVDPDIGLRIVGYAEYAEAREDWVRTEPPIAGDARPVRLVELLSRLPDADGEAPRDAGAPVIRAPLHPTVPSHRIAENDVFAIEHVIGADATRVGDLLTPVPPRSPHALIIEIPNAEDAAAPTARTVVTAAVGEEYVIGETGWRVGVKQLLPEPPFPIITEGYENATTPTAVLRITPPEGHVDGPYDRYVYDRFPELNQDIFDTPQADGRPNRRDADAGIRVAYLELTRLRLLLDESPETGLVRTIVREPGGEIRVVPPTRHGEVIGDVVELIDVRVAEAWDHTERVEFPVPVPDPDRERRFIGTHDFAMAAVEVSVPQADADAWTQIIWIPFSRYLETSNDLHRDITLPDGRELTLAFGRLRHPFPGFGLRLLDFEMIAYDHRGAPRDYQSVLRVVPQAMPGDAESRSPLGEPYERVAKLNAPLRAPFVWDEARSWFGNVAITLTRGLNPNQYKLSQAGWDQQGWQETQTLADAGTLERPFARFTILQVGNNPGIHVIAFGGVLMSLGIPWAFYLKPWLVRREKERLKAMHMKKVESNETAPAPRERAPMAEKETVPV
ncbi:MAG: hypothetical protein AAF297_04590 [Planctomycetota bacterium]